MTTTKAKSETKASTPSKTTKDNATETKKAETTAAKSDENLDEDDVEATLKMLEDSDDKAPSGSKSASTSKSANASKKTDAPAQPKRDFFSVASIDKQAFDSNLDAAAKKVAEKIINMKLAIENGKKLSRYTKDAVKVLDKEGNITGKSMVEYFQKAGLGEGTARAQAQQITSVFKATGVCQPDKSDPKLLVPADAKLLKELVQLAA